MLAHSVFFSLNDNSEAAIRAMVGACKKYLSDHPGVAFFAADHRLRYGHFVWHLFVLTGTFCHYVAVLQYA